MKFDIIIQARYQSTRLPGKILLNFDGTNFLEFLIKNLKRIKSINRIIIITPKDEYLKIFSEISKKNKVFHFFSQISENNLISRYFNCAKKYKSSNIIRITSDCPFINPIIIKKMMNHYKKNNLKFLTNNKPRFVPHGFDCEIISFEYLKKSYLFSKSNFDKEHPTQWIYRNIFKKKNESIKLFKSNISKVRLTLDYPSDFHYFLKNIDILSRISKNSNYENLCKRLLIK